MRILIVDDIESARYILKTNLEYNGFTVMEASNGEQALETVRKTPPDLIITDILMPVMDGFQLCRHVKEDERLKHIPFIFYTATYTDQKDEELALKLGADRYIRKPEEPDKFAKIIREVIKAAEKGEIQPKAEQIEYGEDVFRLYDERLVQKLEKKMLELQKEIDERKKAEEKLKESEERYRSVFQNTGAATVIIEPDMTLSMVNSEFENLSGYSKDELEGKKCWTEFVAREDLERMQGYHHKRRENGNEVPRDYEFQFVDRLGIVKNILVKVGMIPGRKKSVASLIDITQRRRAEAVLERSRREWEDIFHAIGHLTLILDPDNKILAVNRIGERIIGRSSDAIIGKKCYEVFHGAPAPPPGCPFLKIKDTGAVETAEMEVEVFDRVFMVSCTPVMDLNGNLEKVIHVATDITDRKRSERALKESEERFRLSFDNANIGMCLVNLEGRLIRVNPKMCEIFGYDQKELENMTVNDITHPEDVNTSPSFIRQAVSGEVEHAEFEKRYFDKHGKLVWGRISSSIIRDSQGVPIYFISHVKDISEQKAVEQSLREGEQKYKLLVENLPCIIFKGFKDWSVEFFDNKIELLSDYGKDEFNSKSIKWIDIILKEDIEAASKIFIQALKTDRSYVREYRIRSKAEGIKWVQERGHIICNENGEIDHISGVFFDITQTKKLEDKLRQAQKMESIGTLAGGVAHDFNNFLSIILGNADLMLMDLRKDHPFYNNISEISKAGKGAASLTRQLLAFSRKQVIQPEIMNLNDVINTTIKMLGRLIGENVELRTFLDPALDLVQIDSGQMEQVIINLAVNARDAMPGGGKLTVETRNLDLDEHFFKSQGVEGEAGPHVMLRVSDTGIGMDEKILPHIFDPFFTTKGIEKGTGLGLSTVYGIVKQNNGYIFVQSQPGQGSAFDIYLPAAKRAKKTVTAEKISEDGLTGSETILVVEDDETLRRLTSRVLAYYGYRVLKAPNGDEALKVSQEHEGPIHLILTDVIMPGMNVREMAEQIQSRRKESKVLYMSGYTDESISWYGVLEPGIHLLEKPYTPERLARKVREVLDRDSGK